MGITTTIIILASVTYYSDAHAGNLTASGEPFDPYGFTGASWLWPLGTELTVRWNDKEVIIVLNDRSDHRTDLDLSIRAFEHIADVDIGRIQAEVIFSVENQTQAWKDEHGEAYELEERNYERVFPR